VGVDDHPLALRGRLGTFDRDRLRVPAPDAAVALLGALLVRDEPDGTRTVVRVVETEAYRQDDPASHSFVGRTARTAPMFGPAGTSYVYRSYGIHWCCNVTVEDEGVGAAVLLRAAVALTNRDHLHLRRSSARHHRDLLRGPGRLAAALDLDGPRHTGGDLIEGVGGLRLGADGWRPTPQMVASGPRTGIRLAVDVPWRFHLVGVPEVSPYRRHPGAVRPTGDES
jgi:DNA-3-methyladenine glycosylase